MYIKHEEIQETPIINRVDDDPQLQQQPVVGAAAAAVALAVFERDAGTPCVLDHIQRSMELANSLLAIEPMAHLAEHVMLAGISIGLGNSLLAIEQKSPAVAQIIFDMHKTTRSMPVPAPEEEDFGDSPSAVMKYEDV